MFYDPCHGMVIKELCSTDHSCAVPFFVVYQNRSSAP